VTLTSICACSSLENWPRLMNRIFVLNSEALDSSTFKIAVFRRSKRPFSKTDVIPMGEVILSMGDFSAGNREVIGE
jgi:hypothetical protein